MFAYFMGKIVAITGKIEGKMALEIFLLCKNNVLALRI
jgi:hypothetical protein